MRKEKKQKITKNVQSGKGDLLPPETIVDKILLIRGQKVMLDRDLADLYGVDTGRLNEQVKRNQKRFPTDFMFQLTKKEAYSLVSQNAIPSKRSLGGTLPHAFTEQGVSMLSSVLNSDRAIKINIQIMRAFTNLRKMIIGHKDMVRKIDKLEEKFGKHDNKIRIIFESIKQLLTPVDSKTGKIGFRPGSQEEKGTDPRK